MPSGSGPTSPTPLNGRLSERRHSNSSEGSYKDGFTTNNRTTLLETSSRDYLGGMRTRVTKAAPPKPAANPMQFVKIKPCNLYQTAQEQVRRCEEVKKVQEVVKEEAEEWQSNLDNWKSSRRKRVEHIIDRVVEVKKLELEEHDRNRKRSKTFNEMMEERQERAPAGARRKCSLPVYAEDDSHDLSDLGLGTSSASGKSSVSEDCDNHSVTSDSQEVDNMLNHENGNIRESVSSPGYDTSSTAPASSPDPLEYTYEGAINDYKSRVSRTNSSNLINGRFVPSARKSEPNNVFKKRNSVGKIEERLSSFGQKQTENTESIIDNIKKQLPKIDVLKRRELFEKEKSPSEEQLVKIVNRKSGDFSNPKSIKERLSHLEKQNEEATAKASRNTNRLSGDITTIRERLSNLGLHNSEDKNKNRVSTRDFINPLSVKDRLNNLQMLQHEIKTPSVVLSVDSVKNFTDVIDMDAVEKEIERSTPETDKERSVTPDFDNKNQLHQSFDSLDVERDFRNRMQSLDDLEASSAVGSGDFNDTDREDSGIHTADVSCSVSQADEQPGEVEPDEHVDQRIGEVDVTIVANLFDNELLNDKIEDDISVSPVTPLPSSESNEEEDTFCSPEPLDEEPDGDVLKALDLAFEAIDSKTPGPFIVGNDKPSMDHAAKTTLLTPLSKVTEIHVNHTQNNETIQPVVNQTTIVADDSFQIDDAKPVISDFQSKSNEKMASKSLLGTTVPMFTLDGDGEFVSAGISGLEFLTLGSASSAEPPKEKPPPPPVDDDDEYCEPMKDSFKRVNSTKRIKNELRNKRSSFLGIEGSDSYLEAELSIVPPPDMTSFLREERRLEQQLYRQSVCYDSDTNLGEIRDQEGRDSGVELERAAHSSDDTWSNKQTSSETLSEQHSRQSSEPFTVTSEEDEISKKEREIIEILEKEEQWRYGGNGHPADGEELATKLRQLEREKLQLEHDRSEEERRTREEDDRVKNLEDQIREQQNYHITRLGRSYDEDQNEEVLRVERELLQLEQEELKRQRDNLIFRENQARRGEWGNSMATPNRYSLQDINASPYVNVRVGQSYAPPTRAPPTIGKAPVDCRKSMPDLHHQSGYRKPPPIPPTKPLRSLSQEQKERDSNIRNSRLPSADSFPITDPVHLRHGSMPAHMNTIGAGQQMTKHTLHALSAAPRTRHIETWIQSKRKSEPIRENTYNSNQHWLIQEAEQRRIEKQRGLKPRSGSPPNSSPVAPIGSNGWKHTRPDKHLPDSVIQTLTQRVQNRAAMNGELKIRRRFEASLSPEIVPKQTPLSPETQEKMLSVSGKKKCSHCGDELGRGAAMIIESLRLFYHIDCFKCCVCRMQLGDGLMGTDVRVRNHKLHCHNCYSSDDGVKFSCV